MSRVQARPRSGSTGFDTESLVRAGAFVAGCTLVLTAGFVGLLAIVTGEAFGVGNRLPLYVLGMALAFVATIVLFEARGDDGRRILFTAGIVALGGFLVALLSGEGFVYAARNPGVVASQLLLYLLAAGMIGTGLGYWGIRHWGEAGVLPTGRTR